MIGKRYLPLTTPAKAGAQLRAARSWAPAFAGVVAASLALTACASNVPERVVDNRTTETPAPRSTTLLRTTMLETHNTARHAVGVAPIAWDDTLAADAKAYAETMARTGRFEHAPQPLSGPAREGENLFTGTRDAYQYREMIGFWVAEKRDFINGVTPAFSRTGKWEDVAHYTQIVWRASTRVGCATASNKHDDYLVCRYSPAGNVVGEKAF